MQLPLEASTLNSLMRMRTWLEDSSRIIGTIENVLEPTTTQVHTVGSEWAGTLSRLA